MMYKSVLVLLLFAFLTTTGLPTQSIENEEDFQVEQPVKEATVEYESEKADDTSLTQSDAGAAVEAEPGKEDEIELTQSETESPVEVEPDKGEQVSLEQSDDEPPAEAEPDTKEEIELKQNEDEPPVEAEPGTQEDIEAKQTADEPTVEVEPDKEEQVSLNQSDDEPPVVEEPDKEEEVSLKQSDDELPMEADPRTKEESELKQSEGKPPMEAMPGAEEEIELKQSEDEPPVEAEPGSEEEVSLKQSDDEPPVLAEPAEEEEEEEFLYEPLEYRPYSEEELAREDEVSQELSKPEPPVNVEPTSEAGDAFEHSDPEPVNEPPALEENEISTEQSEGEPSADVESAEEDGFSNSQSETLQPINVESDEEHLFKQSESAPLIGTEIVENEGVAITHHEIHPVVELEPGPAIEEAKTSSLEVEEHKEPSNAESESSENLVDNIMVEPRPDVPVNLITDVNQPAYFESEDIYNESRGEIGTVDAPTEDENRKIDVVDQEITFDTENETPREPIEATDVSEPEYTTSSSHENTLEEPDLNKPHESSTPVYEPEIVPEVAYTTGPERSQGNVPHDYGRGDRPLIYTPEPVFREEYQPRPKPYEPTTSSYERRMSQIDEYRREEERRKRMYESQNIYRRPDLRERDNTWPRETHTESMEGCGFDYLGRKVNCSSTNTFMPIEMRDHHQGARQYIPPPENFELPEEASEDALEDEMAMRRANPVYLSMSRWPVRNVNHLGHYPRHPACRLSPKWGVGPEELSAWFYSQADGRCLWFAYAGHGGNANRFYSRASCDSLCVFDQDDLCLNVRCGYPGSRCILRGDDRCKAYAKSRGKDLDLECPPDQPVCRARRALIAPEYDAHLVPGECMEEVDAGGCLVKSPQIRYHYDSRSNTCRSFYFHGCGGNNNRFESMQECMNHCAL
uniref:SEA domain-containing protein n=2 Tax=Mesocestoides corti TaxID=53468 RepID=A0A5K3EM77_MESCO